MASKCLFRLNCSGQFIECPSVPQRSVCVSSESCGFLWLFFRRRLVLLRIANLSWHWSNAPEGRGWCHFLFLLNQWGGAWRGPSLSCAPTPTRRHGSLIDVPNRLVSCWSGAQDRVDTVHNTIMMQMQAAIKSLSEFWTFGQGGSYKRLRLTVSEPEQQLKAAVRRTRVPFVCGYSHFINRSLKDQQEKNALSDFRCFCCLVNLSGGKEKMLWNWCRLATLSIEHSMWFFFKIFFGFGLLICIRS